MPSLQINLRKRPKHQRIGLENDGTSKPAKTPRLDKEDATIIGGKEEAESLDSLLEAMPNSTGASTILEEDEKDLDSVAPQLSQGKGNSSRGKLEKIAIDHSSFPFQKKLYQDENTASSESVNYFRELYDIHVRPIDSDVDVNVINPILDWNEAGLPLPLMRVVKHLGYSTPMPIQSQTLPIVMSGRDVVGIAPTGSGKTAAFLIPMCRHIAANLETYSKYAKKGPYAVVLVPTRELCIQISNELDPWATALGLRVISCYGGSNIADQISKFVNNQCHITVATPGRLIDLLAANNGRVLSLGSVTFLVVDETDRMFDLGFGPQVRKIVETIRPDRQTAVFSATMLPAMEVLVKRILTHPLKILVGAQSTVPSNVQQIVDLVNPDQKLESIMKLLLAMPKNDSAIVFVSTQSKADDLNFKLIKKGIKCQTLHGGMDQRDREDVIDEFKRGNLDVLVATSVAARGLDLKQLKLVVNYDAASHLEDYVHRAGRTGRAGERGRCVTFLEPDQKLEAFQISKCVNIDHDEELKKMANEYASIADRKTNKRFGFGGHGLSRLENKWNLQKTVERDAYSEVSKGAESETEENLKIHQHGSMYFARLMLENAPKEARIAVTSAAKQNEIIEKCHVSLTLKGVYTPDSKRVVSDESRLHLLIESSSKENVTEAYHDLGGLLLTKTTEANASGRYSAF